MRKTYRFLKKSMYYLLINLLIVAIFSIISFSFMCVDENQTLTLKFPHVVTIMLYLFVLLEIGLAVFVALKAKAINITHIKKQNKFFQFASVFCAIMMIIFFIYECIISITKANFQLYFVFRVSRWLLTIPMCAYFIVQALPKKIRRTKTSVPRWFKITLSVCAILWSVLGILTVYFGGLKHNDISKITLLLTYVAISVFLVFEGEFEFVKAAHKPYIISAFVCTTLAIAFPFGISIGKILNKINPYRAFSQPELLLAVAIGIYALSKMLALVSTMHTVIENSSTGGHSSKFDTVSTKPTAGNSDSAE